MGKTVAVLGASGDRRKYGNKAVRAFRQEGWTVYPVNAKADEIEGLKCYHTLAETPGPVDRISVYLPPALGRQLLPEIARKGAREVFFNPGSEDKELVEQAQTLGIRPILACSVLSIGRHPEEYPDE